MTAPVRLHEWRTCKEAGHRFDYADTRAANAHLVSHFPHEFTLERDDDVIQSDLSTALDNLEVWLRRYIHFARPEQTWAITLWVATTHLQTDDRYPYDVFPYLLIMSAEKESGKTTLLDMIEFTCHNPRRVDDVSPAALGRIMTSVPTVLIDEVDSLFGKGAEASESKQALRGILNTGYRKGGVYTRSDQKGKVVEMPTFGPKVLAGLGRNVPDTIVGRSVYIRMERKPRDSVLPKARLRLLRQEGSALRDALMSPLADLEALYLDMDMIAPDTLTSRQQDVWEPLYAIAVHAAGDWPKRVQAASEFLTASDEETMSVGQLLLRDIREVFGDEPSMHLTNLIGRAESPDERFSHDVGGLCSLESSPWATYNHGRPVSPRQVSRLLKAYDISLTRLYVGARQAMGYYRFDFEKAWERYLPADCT